MFSRHCKKCLPEDKAIRNIPMTMKDWTEKLNAFLQFNERDILDHPGKVSRKVANRKNMF